MNVSMWALVVLKLIYSVIPQLILTQFTIQTSAHAYIDLRNKSYSPFLYETYITRLSSRKFNHYGLDMLAYVFRTRTVFNRPEERIQLSISTYWSILATHCVGIMVQHSRFSTFRIIMVFVTKHSYSV